MVETLPLKEITNTVPDVLPETKKRAIEPVEIKEHSSIVKRKRKEDVKKYEQFSPNNSVVKVFVTKNSYNYVNPWTAPTQVQSYASGFIIEGKRIVTNAHVVSNNSFVQVRKAGTSKKYEATVRRVVHSVDLAILEIKDTDNEGLLSEFFENTAPLPLGETPRVGDTVRAYGFPWGGSEMSLTKGVVSRVEMDKVCHSGGRVLACDMDTAITGGNSGGPVMSIPGDDGTSPSYTEPVVVGVVFQGYSSKEGGYMIACEVLDQVIALDDKGDTLEVPILGISVQILENKSLRKSLGLLGGTASPQNCESKQDPQDDNKENVKNEGIVQKMEEGVVKKEDSKAIEGGIMIYKVADYSPAKAILKKRDVLLQIDEFHIGENGTVEFRKGERTKWTYAIARKCLGESVKLKYFRDGHFYTKTVKLDKTRNNIFHVGEKLYDVKPNYLIKAGFVFQPLSLNLYSSISHIGSAVQAKVLEYRSEEHPSYVLMTKVLQADITTGYEMSNQIVETINGKKVNNMADVIEAFKTEATSNDKVDKTEKAEISQHCLTKPDSVITNDNKSDMETKTLAKDRKEKEDNNSEKEHYIELYGDSIITIITRNLEEDTKNVAKKYDIKETMFID